MIIEVDLTMPTLSAKIPPIKGPTAAIAKAIDAIVFPEILKLSPESGIGQLAALSPDFFHVLSISEACCIFSDRK